LGARRLLRQTFLTGAQLGWPLENSIRLVVAAWGGESQAKIAK
jgi:hypothetical protein